MLMKIYVELDLCTFTHRQCHYLNFNAMHLRLRMVKKSNARLAQNLLI